MDFKSFYFILDKKIKKYKIIAEKQQRFAKINADSI